jgi:hypothetical protein
LYFLMGFKSTPKAWGLWWCEHNYPRSTGNYGSQAHVHHTCLMHRLLS